MTIDNSIDLSIFHNDILKTFWTNNVFTTLFFNMFTIQNIKIIKILCHKGIKGVVKTIQIKKKNVFKNKY